MLNYLYLFISYHVCKRFDIFVLLEYVRIGRGGEGMFIVNVEGAIKKGDRWLVIERSRQEEHAGGLLSLVGGKVEQEGNTTAILERTLRREIEEEVGVQINNMTYIHSTSFVTAHGIHVVNVVFLCEYESGEARPVSLEEVAHVYWLTTEEILQHPQAPSYLKESIEHAEAKGGWSFENNLSC
jgi:8-oxo-dGTP diphosphatase